MPDEFWRGTSAHVRLFVKRQSTTVEPGATQRPPPGLCTFTQFAKTQFVTNWLPAVGRDVVDLRQSGG